jgi:hypothetical protein
MSVSREQLVRRASVDAGTLSLDFLDSAAWALPESLPITYRD